MESLDLRGEKPDVGNVTLEVGVTDDRITIRVQDDGKGLDRDAIVNKAVAKGLLNLVEAQAMTDDQVFQLIFRSGFSTAESVTEVSGRGVGLDAVKTAVEEAGGSIRVHSAKGLGSNFIIQAPLSENASNQAPMKSAA